MELTRDNFIQFVKDEKIITFNDDFSKLEMRHINFNCHGGDIIRKISLAFFDGTLTSSPIEPTFPSTHFSGTPQYHKETYRRVWIEDLYEVEIYYIYEYFVTQYFEKTGERKHLNLMKLLKVWKTVEDDYMQTIRKFYHWFVTRHFSYLVKIDDTTDLFKKFQSICEADGNIIHSFGDDIFTFDPKSTVEFYERECGTDIIKCKVHKVHGFYLDGHNRHYTMYEDGRIRDRISTRREKFDPVVAMLTKYRKT